MTCCQRQDSAWHCQPTVDSQMQVATGARAQFRCLTTHSACLLASRSNMLSDVLSVAKHRAAALAAVRWSSCQPSCCAICKLSLGDQICQKVCSAIMLQTALSYVRDSYIQSVSIASAMQAASGGVAGCCQHVGQPSVWNDWGIGKSIRHRQTASWAAHPQPIQEHVGQMHGPTTRSLLSRPYTTQLSASTVLDCLPARVRSHVMQQDGQFSSMHCSVRTAQGHALLPIECSTIITFLDGVCQVLRHSWADDA